jgi:hypothetical protein
MKISAFKKIGKKEQMNYIIDNFDPSDLCQQYQYEKNIFGEELYEARMAYDSKKECKKYFKNRDVCAEWITYEDKYVTEYQLQYSHEGQISYKLEENLRQLFWEKQYGKTKNELIEELNDKYKEEKYKIEVCDPGYCSPSDSIIITDSEDGDAEILNYYLQY